MASQLIFYIFVFIFGTIVGSFLNVLILRYNTGVSALQGRSFCFSCGKKLTSRELVPILSFIFQGGRCTGCRSKISWQYPAVEFLTGLLFVGVFIKYLGPTGLFHNIWLVLISLTVMAVLNAITVYDLKHKIIPDGLVITFGALGLLKIIADFFLPASGSLQTEHHLIWSLAAGPILALPLFLIWLFSRGKWMGLGDSKLTLGLGWFLGPVMGLSAVILAFWTGAVYGLILLALSKSNWHGLQITGKTEVPFAPFLVLGFLLVFFFNIDILGLGFLIP